MGYGEGKGKQRAWEFRSFVRRKQVDSERLKPQSSHHQLAKALSVGQLVAIGVGTTIGAGVYVLVGTVAREYAGPALTISFLIAGVAAALSAFCYAELAGRCPSAGSAYHYSYICIGEGVAWLIGWSLILEYTIGGAAIARGISPNLTLFIGGQDGLLAIFSRFHIPILDVVVDPCAAALVFVVTGLLSMGIKESSLVQSIVTIANVCVMLFVIIAGGYIGFQTGWIGYQAAGGYFPFGVNGMLAGSATVFFAFIGFDAVASTAEEVKNPQRDLPLGIGTALSLCCLLYMMVSLVIVGLVPYFAMDPDTPISSAFASNGVQWVGYVVTAGAVLSLCSSLLGSLLPQPRVLMAMARDGLLPPLFAEVNTHTQVPLKSTIMSGTFAAVLAFFMDVSQLAGMVSVGTLLAFTVVAVSILILRYVPPNEVPLPSLMQDTIFSVSPLPSSMQDTIFSVSSRYIVEPVDEKMELRENNQSPKDDICQIVEASIRSPLILKDTGKESLVEQTRRKKAALSIASVCIGVLILTTSASATFFPVTLQYSASCFGGLILICGLVVLFCIDQDDGRHSFGHSGGFICPFVPILPTCCILINGYLLVNLGVGTWVRVSIWLLIGALVYLFYGRTHSSLINAVYVTVARADEVYRTSSGYIA